uniref:Uncharacterized protein n=1 Tax=Physcomitrium patens TaxID=3218 RepID=A0A7I4A5D4_PHYPA
MGTRVLLITNAALYNLKGDNFDCHRRLPLSKISSIIRCYLRQQFIIKVKREKARSYLSEEVSVICDSIRFAQAVKCHAACPITYKKKKELNNFVLRMAKHTLNRINAKIRPGKKLSSIMWTALANALKRWMLILSSPSTSEGPKRSQRSRSEQEQAFTLRNKVKESSSKGILA